MAPRPFLRIDREGTNLRVRIDPMLNTDPPVVFQFLSDRQVVVDAELAVVRLSETYRAIVEEARRKAYAEGYRDGRAKRRKTVHFWTWLGRDAP